MGLRAETVIMGYQNVADDIFVCDMLGLDFDEVSRSPSPGSPEAEALVELTQPEMPNIKPIWMDHRHKTFITGLARRKIKHDGLPTTSKPKAPEPLRVAPPPPPTFPPPPL